MASPNKPYDHIFKVTVTGDSGVGKTNIISRFTNNRYSAAYNSTIGVEFSGRTVTINGAKIKAQMWDTAGQERYGSITNVYYRGSIGALLVYDVTSQASLAAIPHWLRELRDHARRDIVLMLVGNKIDCDDDAAAAAAEGPEAVAAAAAAAAQGLSVGARQVPRAEAEALAAEYGLLFAEVSAKTGEGVEDAVTRLLAKAYEVTVAGANEAAAAGGQTGEQAPGAAQVDVTKPVANEGDSGKCCK